MTDHLISYLKCVSLPSENIKSQRKKNFESLLKICKKSKRDFTIKLNKNQVEKSQVISYYENKRNQLNKIKKDRLEKIILLTQEFINDRSDDEIESDSDNNNTSDSKKKRHIEEYDNGQSKKLKLISVEEEIGRTPAQQEDLINENVEIRMEVEVSLDKLPNNLNPENVGTFDKIKLKIEKSSEEGIPIKQINKTFKIKSVESEKLVSAAKPSEKMIINPKPTIMRNVSSTIKPQIPTISSIKPTGGKIGPTPVRVMTNKHSDLRTPQQQQQQQPIYKGKHQHQPNNNLSLSKTNSLSKSQTLSSSQKKPVAEIRKQQDKLEEEKKRKLEEKEAKRKENLMKLDEIKNSKKLQALAKSTTNNNNNSSSMKQAVLTKLPINTIVPSAGTAVAAAVVRQVPVTQPSAPASKKQVIPALPLPQNHPIATNKIVTLESHMRTNQIVPAVKPTISAFSGLKPINSSQKLPQSIIEESPAAPDVVVVVDNFKTPFVKKRTTILSDSCKKIINNHESYYLSDLIDVNSDEEEEENRPNHEVPRWCHKENGTLINLVKYQSKHYSPSEIFLEACFVRIDYKQIFGSAVEIKAGCLEPWN